MKNFKIVVLVLSGLALFYASSSRLINPAAAVFLQTFFENSVNSLATDVDLVNEIRGVGAVMLLGGIVAIWGAVRADFRQTAFVVTAVIFGGVILGRSISLLIDGVPNANLMRAAVIEAVLAALNVFSLAHILIRGNVPHKELLGSSY